MRYILPLALAAAWPGAALAAGSAPIQQCDTLAQHPSDPDKIMKGVATPDVNHEAAIVACRAATALYPDEARFHYQLGRALFYRNRPEDIRPAMDALSAASDREYRQATFVLGLLYSLPGKLQDRCRAGHLWRRTLAQGHSWTKYYLTRHYLLGDFQGCSFTLSPAEMERAVHSFAALDLDSEGERQTDALLKLFAEKGATAK